MKPSRCLGRVLAALALPWLGPIAHAQGASDSGWPSYSGGPGGERYSPLAQIDRENVARLAVAWTYRTGALDL
ncbi:MAG TPA: hypothetical protein VKA01_01495, partial [Vicinamibacteria bacterium]|nr:hypothetical protein [Vicinamibacteria bacterium]